MIIQIKEALDEAPRNAYMAEMHLQVIKHFDVIQDVTGREFCDALEIGSAFGTEFSKMKKITPRLLAAGLDLKKV